MQSVDHLKECREFYLRELQSHFGVPLGVSKATIFELQQKLGFVLPESFSQFLLWMGDDKRGALKGSDWFADDILPNDHFLDEFLAGNGVLEADNDLGVVRNFIDSERLRDNLPILDAIDKILLQDEAEVSSFLIESGCQYYFAADGFTAKQWLERLRSEFVNEVLPKEN